MDNVEEKLSEALFEDTEEQEEVTNLQEETVPEISTVKVGEKEYTQDELSRLVQLGEMGKEVEERYNTKLDRVYPEYTKATQRVRELEKIEQEYVKSQQNKINVPENEEQAIKEAREAARKLGLVDVETFRDELGKSFREYYEKERAAERILDQARGFEKEIDGSDGRPKFETEKVLQFMVDSGVQDLMTAYKVMNESNLDVWKEQQLGKAKKAGLKTQESTVAGSSKQPADVKVNKDNFDQLLQEALEGKI
jgi:hypothetical protein